MCRIVGASNNSAHLGPKSFFSDNSRIWGGNSSSDFLFLTFRMICRGKSLLCLLGFVILKGQLTHCETRPEEYCNSIRESQDQEISQFKRNFIKGVFSKSDHFRDIARVATVLKEYKETNGYTHNSMKSSLLH